MSLNLLDILKDQVGNQLIGEASKFLGEKEEATGKALDGIFPSLLGSIIQKGSNESGANSLMNLLTDQDDSIFDNIGGLFTGGASPINDLMGGGSNLLSSLLGDKVGGLVDFLSSFSGLKSSSSSALLKMAAPFVMSLIGKQVKSQGLNIGGLMKMLGGQKSFVEKALPSGIGSLLGLSGFNLGDMAKDALSGTKNAVEKSADIGGDAIESGAKVGGNLLKWLIPVLLLLFVLSWFGLKTCNSADKAVDLSKDAATGAVEMLEDAAGTLSNVAGDAAQAVSDATANAISASGEFVNNAVKNVNIAAKKALTEIKFTAGSVGEQINTYIDGGANGANEFRFGQLNFDSGSAKITGQTANEIDHLAAILNAYPSLNILIEGHTDNTGSAEANQKMSLARAEAVKNRLIVDRIEAGRIATLGHGSSKPIADNSTEEGRIQNRRIVVRIVE